MAAYSAHRSALFDEALTLKHCSALCNHHKDSSLQSFTQSLAWTTAPHQDSPHAKRAPPACDAGHLTCRRRSRARRCAGRARRTRWRPRAPAPSCRSQAARAAARRAAAPRPGAGTPAGAPGSGHWTGVRASKLHNLNTPRGGSSPRCRYTCERTRGHIAGHTLSEDVNLTIVKQAESTPCQKVGAGLTRARLSNAWRLCWHACWQCNPVSKQGAQLPAIFQP